MQKTNFSKMISNNKYHYSYNDGYVHFGEIEIIRNEKKIKIGEQIKEIGVLPFSNVTIRDNDNIVASSLGYTINKKIMVPFREIPQNIKVTINNDKDVYDIVSYVTPNPGGVGPMTVAMIIDNLIEMKEGER